MIPSIYIEKLQTSLYEMHVCFGTTTLTDSSTHNSISEALKFIGEDAPREMFHYADIHYGGVSIGTQSLDALAFRSEELAHDLVRLCSIVSQHECAAK